MRTFNIDSLEAEKALSDGWNQLASETTDPVVAEAYRREAEAPGSLLDE